MGLADSIHISPVCHSTYLTEREQPLLAYLARELWPQSKVRFVPVKRTTCPIAATRGFRHHLRVLLLLSLALRWPWIRSNRSACPLVWMSVFKAGAIAHHALAENGSR